jgi:uncharacterized membrane protein YkvA (DUF1232 family)
MKKDQSNINKGHMDFYQKMRRKINTWAHNEVESPKWFVDYILMAPDLFHLLVKLTADPEVPASEKLKLGVAIAYFITPVDLIAELIVGPIGFFDDVVLASYALNAMINRVHPELIKKHWAGEEDVLTFIQSVLLSADRLLGSGLFKRIKGMLK